MAETQVLGWGTQSAPATRTNGGNESWELLAVDATFDGTGAAGDFVPALQIVADSGQEVGTFPLQDTVTAGDSVRVTFAPFLRSGGAGGIKFDTFPQTGDWLEVDTTGSSPSGDGLRLNDTGHGIHLVSSDATFGEVLIETPFIHMFTPLADLRLLSTGSTSYTGTDATLSFPAAIAIDTAAFSVTLDTAGGVLEVFDRFSNPLFRIDQDGSLHGKTGKSLTFDL